MPEVYIYDILEKVSASDKAVVTRNLNDYLSRCATKGVPVMRAWWWSWDPDPSGLDILVYVVPFGKSVVRKRYIKAPSPISGHDGLTYPTNNQPTISEVYYSGQDPETLAKLIFHEMMHMKLRMGNEMHSIGGLASASVGPDTDLTKPNIERMRPALRQSVQQWTDGIEILRQQKAAIDAGDTLTDVLE